MSIPALLEDLAVLRPAGASGPLNLGLRPAATEAELAAFLARDRLNPGRVLVGVMVWPITLYFIIHALGLHVGLALVLFAALANSLLTKIPVTPGGLGFVELGLTGLLALSLPRDSAASVTILDRTISYFSLVVLGGLVFAIRQAVVMRRRKNEASTTLAPK